jgi:hypothetical protein
MAEITVVPGAPEGDRLSFEVRVAAGGSETAHEVTVARAELERLSKQGETGAQFIRRCFEFLLEREPKESILGSFDISVIGTYFPDFEREIGS